MLMNSKKKMLIHHHPTILNFFLKKSAIQRLRSMIFFKQPWVKEEQLINTFVISLFCPFLQPCLNSLKTLEKRVQNFILPSNSKCTYMVFGSAGKKWRFYIWDIIFFFFWEKPHFCGLDNNAMCLTNHNKNRYIYLYKGES